MFIRKTVMDLDTNVEVHTTIITEPIEDIWELLTLLKSDSLIIGTANDCE